MAAFVEAHEQAFRAQNIIGGFRGTGIHPFQPTKVLRQVFNPTPPRPSTLSNSTTSPTPFNDAVLTSSPTDINAIRAANATFNALIQSGEPISTAAKKYFAGLARSSERNFAHKIILQQEKEGFQAVVSARKSRLSGKRKVIEGESLITTMKRLNGVREAERITREKPAKKQKGSKKRSSKARIQSSDEPEVESDDSNDGVVWSRLWIVLRFNCSRG